MIIFTLRRILLLIVTLFLLTFVWLQFELFHSTRAVTRRVTVECLVFWFNG